ncbi:hypothetical protein SAMN02745866_01462 [Alteromonadaceae bacterium Bs31]|nr:hypothetical protein SAMN02745866_01462 [Alteromonadaceae bacterium Bs31]
MRTRTQPSKVTCCLLIFILVACSSQQRTFASDKWRSLILENDFIADDDAGYSNGLGVSWGRYAKTDFHQLSGPDWLLGKAKRLPWATRGDYFSFSQSLSQSMFTPEDLESEELIENDRPYAGLLLWQSRLNSFTSHHATRYQLQLGVVGPASGAEQLQSAIHSLRGVGSPNGWKHQLKNEPVLAFSAETLHRLPIVTSSLFNIDTVGFAKLQAGNLKSEAGAGFSIRLGRELQASFPTANLMPGRSEKLFKAHKPSWYVFISAYAAHVFNDITLTGNTMHDSHSVSLVNKQLQASAGMAIETAGWAVVTALQDGSPNFDERDENRLFLHLALTYSW